LLQAIGRSEAAAEAFARALARVETWRNSNNLPAEATAAMRHQIFTAKRDMPAAIREVSGAIQRHPDNAGLLNERCWSRATGNIELELALADCDRALALAPNNAAFLDSRAMVKLRLGRTEEAIADATAALAAAPRLAPALYIRGVAHMRRGDRASAERDLAMARRLAFDIDLIYRSYGVTP
jgi:tetratricopeptide (TPR) repeat protein